MRPKAIVALFVILLFSFSYYKYHRWQQHEDIRVALEYGRLASLPHGANEIRVDTGGSMFSRTFWLSFKADKVAIDKWVAQSPSLFQQAPKPLSPSSIMGDNPDWFIGAINIEGVMFQIPWNEEQLHGIVWINYQKGTVCIKTSHS
jgi:hypothetical protein